MDYGSENDQSKSKLEQKTFFSIRMYELLFFSTCFCFIYSLYHTGIILWLIFFGSVWMAYHNLVALNTTNLPVALKSVLITGCDSGMGLDLAKFLIENNFRVFAGCLNTNSGGGLELLNIEYPHLHVIYLNVTDDESVNQCVGIVKEVCSEKGLWALVNNAGIDRDGSVEFSTMDMYEKVMKVNYFGTVRVTKAFLPFIRMAKGRILNVSSYNGRFSVPNRAVYCPSKYAVESFSDILRLEVRPFGVKVCVIEPGEYGNTNRILDAQKKFLDVSLEHMWNSASEDVRNTYGKSYLYHLRRSVEDVMQTNHTNTRPVIDAMYDAIISPVPKFRYLIGGGKFFFDVNTILVYCSSFLPELVMDIIIKNIYLTNWPIPQSIAK